MHSGRIEGSSRNVQRISVELMSPHEGNLTAEVSVRKRLIVTGIMIRLLCISKGISICLTLWGILKPNSFCPAADEQRQVFTNKMNAIRLIIGFLMGKSLMY